MRSIASLIFTLSTLLTLSQIYAVEKAKVLIVRGEVTQLSPGERLARKVRKGQTLLQDTSIVTHSNSFIRLSLEDGTSLSVGPNSKIVLSQLGDKKDKTSVVGLLKGAMRSKVKKSDDGDMKFFVKTRTAALGVRGTEFESVYVPENRVTSLVTYKGNVAMAHLNDHEFAKTEKTVEVNVDRDTLDQRDIEIVKEEAASTDKEKVESIKEVFKKNDVVEVKQGQLSQTVESMATVSKPTILNPVQLNTLYKNDTYEKNSGKTVSGDLLDQSLTIKPAAIETPPEGILDVEKNVYAPKSGGFFDRETGLYIPPAEDALYDQKMNVFVASNEGAIDQKSGEYVAPIGLKLDPNKGFVKQKIKKSAPAEFVAKVEESQQRMNKTLKKELIVGNEKAKTEVEAPYFLSYREMIAKNSYYISVGQFDESIENRTHDINDVDGEAYDSLLTQVGFEFDSGSRFRPWVEISLAFNEFDESNNYVSQSGDKLTGLLIGVKYSLSNHWNLFSSLSLNQRFFVHYDYNSTTSSTNYEYNRLSVPELKLGIQGEIYRYKRFAAEVLASYGVNSSKSARSQTVKGGTLLDFAVMAKYWPSRDWYLGLKFFYSEEEYDVTGTNTGFNYEYESLREIDGAQFTFGAVF